MFEPVVNMVVCTSDPQRNTNAAVIKVHETTISVLSDFGNIMHLTREEFFSRYVPSERWLEMQDYAVIDGIDFTVKVKDRLIFQIAKLNESLEALNQMEIT